MKKSKRKHRIRFFLILMSVSLITTNFILPIKVIAEPVANTVIENSEVEQQLDSNESELHNKTITQYQRNNVPLSVNGHRLQYNRLYYMEIFHSGVWQRVGHRRHLSFDRLYATGNRNQLPVMFRHRTDGGQTGRRYVDLNNNFAMQMDRAGNHWRTFQFERSIIAGIRGVRFGANQNHDINDRGASFQITQTNNNQVNLVAMFPRNMRDREGSYLGISGGNPIQGTTNSNPRFRFIPARDLAANVIVRHVDTQGRELASSVILTADFAGDPFRVEAISIPGYRLVGNSAISGQHRVTPQTLTFRYERITHNLNLQASPTSGGRPTVGQTTVPQGGTTQISANPNPGYRFLRWEVTGANSGVANATNETTTFTMGTANAAVTAVFERITHNLNLQAIPTSGGSVTISMGNANYTNLEPGDTITINATPSPGYHFVGWKLDEESSDISDLMSPTTTFTMGTADVTVTALFGGELTLSGMSRVYLLNS